MELFLSSFAISLFAIFITSISGGGNNLVLFPLLLGISPSNYISTFTVAKVAAAVHSVTSSKIHLKHNTFHKKLLIILIATAILGTSIGTFILENFNNERIFKLILSFILAVSAIYIAVGVPKAETHKKINTTELIVAGIFSILINILNGIFGGTGIFLTAFLIIYLQIEFKKALAITAISYLLVNILQAGYLMLTNIFDPILLGGSILGSIAGSLLGTNFIYLKSNQLLKYLSPIMMTVIAIVMFIQNY